MVLGCSRAYVGDVGLSWGLCGRSWVTPGASVGGLGPLSGLLWEVLDRSWDFCGRSWLAIGASVSGLGLLSGPLWAVLARYRGLRGRSGTAFGCFSKKCVFLEEEHEK